MKRLIHRLIAWYLTRCAGSFHTFPYGYTGRYVVLMDETQYHNFTTIKKERDYIYEWKAHTGEGPLDG